MVKIYYFSGAGHSKRVAEFLAHRLDTEAQEIRQDVKASGDTLAVIFPVYCQNVPDPVARFLQKAEAKHFVLIATYGRMSYGNVIYEASNLVSGDVIAAAYLPCGHTYLGQADSPDLSGLEGIFERIEAPKAVAIPPSYKSAWADIFPNLRSRIGVKIIKNSRCTECAVCESVCPMGEISKGVTNKRCIRCLKCVCACPENALDVKYNAVLRLYLKKKPKNDKVVYL